MHKNLYLLISAIIFGLVALGHFLRLLYGCEILIGNCVIPFWISWFGLFGACILSVWAIRSMARK